MFKTEFRTFSEYVIVCPMRKTSPEIGEYYHIFNRGNNKQLIFFDDWDYGRFIFLIMCLQSFLSFDNIRRYVDPIVRNRVSNTPLIKKSVVDEVAKDRYVDLVCFSLMSNHFHLIVGEKEENGIARYMHKVLLAYTKYTNTKHEKSGHVFQGPYKIVHIEDNEQLLHLSAYIHRNPRDLHRWKNKEHLYPWSSYQDFIGTNRWGELLNTSSIHEQFESKEEYRQFVETSGAKEKDILEDVLLD
ncbi:MAG: putative transposase [Parcubacteria group bacterium Gr01-1014_29]|nr:MAG: putative transposase [Parcubacteria group bacterium Gr01-1014_29]